MNGFNKVILAGNLTRDPEVRYLAGSGTAVANFGLALNRKWRDSQTQEMKEEVTFVDVQAWGITAENVGQYKRKGEPVLIEGRLKLETWEDKQTRQNRSKLIVVAEKISFLPSAQDGSGGHDQEPSQRQPPARPQSSGRYPSARPQSRPAVGSPQEQFPGDFPPEEDDVPF
jgi:single-strand DNA-binding protein